MSKNERETEFLQKVLSYDRNAEILNVGQAISRIQGHIRVLRRAVAGMALLILLAATGLGYAATMSPDYPENLPRLFRHFGFKIPCVLGLASLASLVCFAGLRVGYRKELDLRQEEARRLAEKFLTSRLGAGAPVSDFEVRKERVAVPPATDGASG